MNDDVKYLSLLVISIVLGKFVRTFQSKNKEVFSSSIGILFILLVSGSHTIHPFIITAFTIFLIKYSSKRYIHIISFITLFGYLLLFRTCHYFYLPMPPAHTNAIQMLLTLKMVGICYEIHDTWKKRNLLKEKHKLADEMRYQLNLQLQFEEVDPSEIDILHYAFTYIGVLTGPYYKYRTYKDMINQKFEKEPDFLSIAVQRVRFVPIYLILFVITSHLFPLSFAESKEIFNDYSFLYRIFYMTPVFFTFRLRIYCAFVLSEVSCIMAGLGCYPVEAKSKPGKGPTDQKALKNIQNTNASNQHYDFETIHNIDEWGAEFSPTVRSGMRSWNMTVQYWLAVNVYKRLQLHTALKEAITMLVSAFWHGVYAGYYLSMLTVPFILAVEDYYDKCLRRKLSEKGQKFYDVISQIHKMQQFSYMGMAFLLLRVDAILKYWRSIGFLYHGLIIFLHGIAQYINLIMDKADKKLKKSSVTSVVGNSKVKFIRRDVKRPINGGDIIRSTDDDDDIKPISEGDVIDVSEVLSNTFCERGAVE